MCSFCLLALWFLFLVTFVDNANKPLVTWSHLFSLQECSKKCHVLSRCAQAEELFWSKSSKEIFLKNSWMLIPVLQSNSLSWVVIRGYDIHTHHSCCKKSLLTSSLRFAFPSDVPIQKRVSKDHLQPTFGGRTQTYRPIYEPSMVLIFASKTTRGSFKINFCSLLFVEARRTTRWSTRCWLL